MLIGKHSEKNSYCLTEQIQILFLGEQGALPAIEVVFVPDNQPQETRLGVLTSPGPRSGILSKTSWPKHSPIVAVQPQIRLKREGDGEKTKGMHVKMIINGHWHVVAIRC